MFLGEDFSLVLLHASFGGFPLKTRVCLPIVSVSRGVLVRRELGEVLCMVATRSQTPSPSPRSRGALERESDALLWRGTKYAGDADVCMLMCRVCLEETNGFTAKEIKLFFTRLGMRSEERRVGKEC